MVSCLPRQTGTDELGGKLMASMYRHQLSTFSAPAIIFLRDAAVRKCKWFPTVAECLEILGDYRRERSEADHARTLASTLFHAEDRLRIREENIAQSIERNRPEAEVIPA